MKKLRSRSLIGLLSVFLFASGCSADGNQSGIQDLEAIQNTLRHIPEEQTVSGIQNALSDLVARTAQVNGYSYQLATSFSIDGFLSLKMETFHIKRTKTFQTVWIHRNPCSPICTKTERSMKSFGIQHPQHLPRISELSALTRSQPCSSTAFRLLMRFPYSPMILCLSLITR